MKAFLFVSLPVTFVTRPEWGDGNWLMAATKFKIGGLKIRAIKVHAPFVPMAITVKESNGRSEQKWVFSILQALVRIVFLR